MKSRFKCLKSARNAIEAYLSGSQKSLNTLAWNIRSIRDACLTREDFEQVLAEFKQTP